MEMSLHKFEFVTYEGQVYPFAKYEAIDGALTVWNDEGEIVYAGCDQDGYIRQIH